DVVHAHDGRSRSGGLEPLCAELGADLFFDGSQKLDIAAGDGGGQGSAVNLLGCHALGSALGVEDVANIDAQILRVIGDLLLDLVDAHRKTPVWISLTGKKRGPVGPRCGLMKTPILRRLRARR